MGQVVPVLLWAGGVVGLEERGERGGLVCGFGHVGLWIGGWGGGACEGVGMVL